MNGYHDRVQRHRRMLAEQAASTEQAAVSSFDWVCAPVDGITDAVAAAVPRRHARAAPVDPTVDATAAGPAESDQKSGEEPGPKASRWRIRRR